MISVTLYCSSAAELPEQWRHAAAEVGTWIARHGARLIYGGVARGLMEIAAHACKEAGGQVVGVVPARRCDVASGMADIKIPTCDLNDRKSTMQLLADIFVILPGGYGTLDELASAFAYINFTHQRCKPIVLYNPEGIFDPFLLQLRTMVRRGLMDPELAGIINVVDTPEGIIAALDQFASK